MADITMCNGDSCPLKENCYRHNAVPDEYRQTYFVDAPYKHGECDHYWGIDKFYDEKYKTNKDKR